MNKIVLVTGATSGIGEACAHYFAKGGYNIIATGRRADRLLSLKTSVEKEYSVACLALCFDVQHKKEVDDAVASLPTEWQNISVLVNNAGLALGRDMFDEAGMEDWEQMIDTNIKGLLYVSRAIVPFFKQQGSGHIINVGSIAGKEVYEKGNVYCATKAAVDSISKAQRIDLVKHNIKVTCIHPGAVETEFSLVRHKGDATIANAVYNGWKPLTANDVADAIFYAANLPTHVCINDLVLMPTQQASAVVFNK
jgi:3-hydroxy acid dehydrogenase / malonic semialdehyde reductase